MAAILETTLQNLPRLKQNALSSFPSFQDMFFYSSQVCGNSIL